MYLYSQWLSTYHYTINGIEVKNLIHLFYLPSRSVPGDDRILCSWKCQFFLIFTEFLDTVLLKVVKIRIPPPGFHDEAIRLVLN